MEVFAFEYAETMPIELEKDYPYTGYDDDCTADKSKGAVDVTSYVKVPK